MKILADASLPYLSGLFKNHFQLSTYQSEAELRAHLPHHDVLLCRSTLNVNEALLKNSTVQCVATASSGIDHIDTLYLDQQGISYLDAKGCNATSVADYIIATLAALEHQGHVLGKRAGIIGYGEVGSRVAARLAALDFSVITYDPVKALKKPPFSSCNLSDLLNVDILCIHANLHDDQPFPSHHLINKDFLQQLKPRAIIINAARGELVDEQALLTCPTQFIYCTDVYAHEPAINKAIIDYATLCTPHIAGHSIEAKTNAVVIAAQKIYHHFNLPPPVRPPINPHTCESLPTEASWQNIVQCIYSPEEDTSLLKTSPNIKQTFLQQRQAHQYRHDFYTYRLGIQERKILNILGHK